MRSYTPRRMIFVALISLVLGSLVVGVPDAARAVPSTDPGIVEIDSVSPPRIRATATNNPDRVEGYSFAANTTVTLTVNSAAVADPPTTDVNGDFFYSPSDFDLNTGHVVEVSDGIVTKSLTLVGLTFDVIDYEANTASGTSTMPDGTTVNVGLGNQSGAGEGVSTTVNGGAWTATFTIDVTYDMGGDASIADLDNDETVASAPPLPNIRSSASSNQDRVTGFSFAANTAVTLTVDKGAGPVAVSDPPTTDGYGNFFYSPPGFDLDVGDVVEVTVGAQTKSLTLVGLTFDVINYEANTASGTSDQLNGTTVNVGVGNQSGAGESVNTTVTSGAWTAAFTIDVTDDMGGEASIAEPDNDQTVAFPAPPPWIRAGASSNPDRVGGFNFAANTLVTLKVNTVAVADPPMTDGSGYFTYSPSGFDLDVGDVVEVTVGTQSRSLTLVGLTFDVVDYDADTASGTSDQPDGTTVNVNVGNQFGGANATTTVVSGAWSVAFSTDITQSMGGQASISEPDGDQTFANSPFPPRIMASASSNPDQVQGFNFAANTVVTLKVNTVAVTDPPTTDGYGNFFYSLPGFDLDVGDVVEVTVGAGTRSLTLVGLTFDVLDFEADTASGTSDQPDGTMVLVSVGNQFGGGETVNTTVTSGIWAVAFTIDVNTSMGGSAEIRDLDNDATYANSPQPPRIQASSAYSQDWVQGFNFAPNTLLTLTVDKGAGPVAVSNPPTTDGYGNFSYNYNPTFDLLPGDVVEVSDGTLTRSLTLVGLTFDVLDVETDTASGTSDQPDGAVVQVYVGNQFGLGENVTTTVTSGAWTASFTIDVTTYMGGMASITDPDGDQTMASPPPPPPPSLDVNPSAELTDGQAVTLTGAGWPAGATLYVAQCRLDVPFGFDACDLSAQRTYTVQPDGTLPVSPASTFAVRQNISTASGNLDCGVLLNSCGLRAVVWPGEFGVGSPIALDFPSNNIINFAGASGPVPYFSLGISTLGPEPSPAGMYGNNWAPDASVTIEVDATALSPDATALTNSFGSFSIPHTLMVQAGDLVTVSDATSTKTLVVSPLTVTEVDVNADTIAGTADGAGLDPIVVVEQPGGGSWAAKTAASMTAGAWIGDFSPTSSAPYDIVASSFGYVFQYDADGDATQTFWGTPPAGPTLDLDPATNLIDGQSITLTGHGWPAGMTLYVSQCRLDVPLGYNTCDGSTQQTYTVQPDGTLPVSPASTLPVKENISTTSGAVDCGAAPDSCGLVGTVWPGEFGVGNPIAIDFPSNNIINFGAWPVFQLKPAISIGGAGAETGMIGNDWAPNTEVTIEIDATASSPDATVTTDGTGSFNLARGLLFVNAGDLVTVTDGTSTKTLVVPPLAVTDVDVDTDTISGTAADGTVEVALFGTPSTWVVDVTSGVWTADLPPHDLVTTDTGLVSQYDEDGDGTVVWWSAPYPRFGLGLMPTGPANMYGSGWAPDTEVTIDVDATVLSPDATATTDGAGAFGPAGELTVDAGDLVTVSDGTSTKTLIVPPLSVTDVDVDADTITGTATDGVASVRIGGSEPPSAAAMVDVIAGAWAADFSPTSASPYDLVPGTFGFVSQTDEDGDAAQIPFVAFAPSTAFDFDGDGLADRSVFRPEFGGWYIDGQATRYLGLSGDVPVPADYDGDGRTDPAVFRDGAWYIDAQATKFLGAAGDVPVPGDYDGDGITEIAVYRNGAWCIDGQATRYFGLAGDVPVPGDYNGDGTTEIAVFRPSVGGWYVEGVAPVFYGLSSDVPVPGDYNGDGTTDRAVFRPEVGGWYVDGQVTEFVGLSSDVPMPADYDGDGAAERSVFRPEFGGWYVQDAATVFYGLGTDIPLLLPAAIYNTYY